MSRPPATPGPSERVRISCPGCGRHDWVSWPTGLDEYAWKCFNCEKSFALHKAAKH